MIEQTETLEFLLYTLGGLLFATLPIYSRLFPSINATYSYVPLFNYLAFIFACISSLLVVQNIFNNSIEYVVISSSVFIFLILIIKNNYMNISNLKITNIYLIFISSLFFVLVVTLNFSTSHFIKIAESLMGPGGTWHHWGAYISSSMSLKEGLSIFKDFPSQYGLGPSFILSIVSNYFGWVSSMFYSIAIIHTLYWVMLAYIGLKIANNFKKNKAIIYTVFLFIVTSSYFFYQASISINYPPSLGGLRLFPVSFFIAALFLLELDNPKNINLKIFFMHFIYGVCILWSIETAFYTSLIWWPYYIHIQLKTLTEKKEIIIGLVESIIKLLFIFLLTVVIIIFIYFLIYSQLPDFSVYTVFLKNIPGKLLINLSGPFIFVVLLYIVSLITLLRIYKEYSNSKVFHHIFLLTLYSYAVFSYYIGRSADFNIYPFMPQFTLLLLSMSVPLAPLFSRYFSITTLGLIVFFIFIPNGMNYITHNSVKYNHSELDSYFINSFENPDTTNRGSAINYINSNYNEPVVVIDITSSVAVSGIQRQWNAYNNVASYNYLPVNTQKIFIERSKNKLMINGWIIIHEDMSIAFIQHIKDLFKDSYSNNTELKLGRYTALRFIPRKITLEGRK